MKNARIYFFLLIILINIKLSAQSIINSLIIDSKTNTPIELVTVNDKVNYYITNKDGRINFSTKQDSITIRMLGYETIYNATSDFINKDTIFLRPKPFILEEVLISSENFYNEMAKSILYDYAIQPHKEQFFLRALLKKNNEIQKLIDINGFLERKTLYDTDSVPMPNRNYKVQLNRLRSAEIPSYKYDFKMYDLEGFLNFIASNNMPPYDFDYIYKTNEDSLYIKITTVPKSDNIKTTGHYIVEKQTYNFDEFYVNYDDPNADFIEEKDLKYRLTNYTLTVIFEKNSINGKKQLKQAKVEQKIEVNINNSIDTLNMSYHFIAFPVDFNQKIRRNTKLTKDIFKIKGKFMSQDWSNQETLELTQEVKDFLKKASNKTGF